MEEIFIRVNKANNARNREVGKNQECNLKCLSEYVLIKSSLLAVVLLMKIFAAAHICKIFVNLCHGSQCEAQNGLSIQR